MKRKTYLVTITRIDIIEEFISYAKSKKKAIARILKVKNLRSKPMEVSIEAVELELYKKTIRIGTKYKPLSGSSSLINKGTGGSISTINTLTKDN